MNKFLLLTCNLLFLLGAEAQYQAYPKLEKLYNEGAYDKCIEKADAEIKTDAKEIMPLVWQMRSYIAIDDLDADPLKKNAVTKALNIALRITKKDKEGILIPDLNPDFKKISYKNLRQISNLPENQYANGLALFEKLKTIDNSLNLEYQKYLYMKNGNDEYAFMTLKNLVIRHYSLFRKKTDALENMEEAYAALMNEYYELSRPEFARDVYIKALEVYKNGTLCRENYIGHIASIEASTGYYTDDINLKKNLSECLSADSLIHDKVIQSAIRKIKRHIVIYTLRTPSANPATVYAIIVDYLSVYTPNQYDSTSTFFDNVLSDNRNENLKIDKNTIFDYWIKTKMEIRKQKQPVEAIKSIHIYNIFYKKYEQDFDFLVYCKTAYPALKTAIAPLSAELEQLIIAQISLPDYITDPELMDKYAKKSDSKVIREKQYQIYSTKLSGLLTSGNFSGFAVNIVKALNQYPGDPLFLMYKKQWVIKDYKANYLNSSYGYEQFFSKLPDETKCDAGTVNKKGHDIVLQKINYCRRLAGAPDSCILDDALNSKCQKAALMMSANGALNHAPPKTWKCYTPEGASAAGASNLSLGNAFDDAIMGQMEDDGTGNFACGHRRWILNPANTVFGHGSSLNASSLCVFGTSDPKLKRKIYFNEKQPLCWPSTDYFPVNLIPERWSFSLANVEFEKATVTVTENGKAIPVSLEPLSYGYGLNTLVWIVNGEVSANKTYTVTISNVVPYSPWESAGEVKAQAKTFTYNVIPLQIN